MCQIVVADVENEVLSAGEEGTRKGDGTFFVALLEDNHRLGGTVCRIVVLGALRKEIDDVMAAQPGRGDSPVPNQNEAHFADCHPFASIS